MAVEVYTLVKLPKNKNHDKNIDQIRIPYFRHRVIFIGMTTTVC